MATWKKVIVSGSAAELKAVSSSLGIIIDSENAQSTGYMAVSGSGTSTGSFGRVLGTIQAAQISDPGNLPAAEWDGSRNGDAEISGSLILTGSAGRIPSLEIVGYNAGVGTQKIGNTAAATILSGSFNGNFNGALTSSFNGTIGATNPDTGTFTNITTTGNATIAGDLIVEGVTTEVRTTNLSIEDKLITLASGSVAGDASAVTIEPGIVFSGARIGAGTTYATTLNSGSALYIDKDSQRLTVTTDAVAPNKSVLGMDTNRAHIPLVFTGSFVSNAAGAHIGNFKVDSDGEFYVYTA
jgi:hypothetical protein